MIETQRICLIHYHEIGLKGHNRSSFENRLIKNIDSLIRAQYRVNIKRISGRIRLIFKDNLSQIQAQAACDLLAKIPGVARVSTGFMVERDLKIMQEVAVQAMEEIEEFESFKVNARRSHTDFEIDSMQINQLIGAHLCAHFPDKRVKMKNPDVELRVEVVQGASYILAHSIPGIGGLPVGSAGKLVCLLSSGIDSPVALWKMARRGASCIGIHFSGRPQTSSQSEFLVDDIAQVLQKTGCIHSVYMVAFGDYQKEIALSVPGPLRVIIYRRLMFRVASALAEKLGAKGLVTGESLGQVASQTIENIACTNAATNLPVLRPLIGSDKLDIIEMAQELGTFDISSQDAPDCCTLFMPRNPETHAKLDAVLKAEEALKLDEWVEELVNAAECKCYQETPSLNF